MPSLLIKIGNGPVQRYNITRESVVIGRAETVDVRINDPAVSRVHCQIIRTPSGRWMVQDFGSRNQTFLGDRAISKNELIHGDVITVGPARIVFSGAPVTGSAIAGDTTIGLGEKDPVKEEFGSRFGGISDESEDIFDVSEDIAEMASGEMTMVPDDPLAALAEDATQAESDSCPMCGASKLPTASYCGPCARKLDEKRQAMDIRGEDKRSLWSRLFRRD